MEGKILTKQSAVIAQSVRETVRSGIKQDEVGIYSSSIHENDIRIILCHLFGVSVYHAYTCSLTLLFIVNNAMHHRERTQGHIARFLRPGKSRGITAEIAAKRTSPLA